VAIKRRRFKQTKFLDGRLAQDTTQLREKAKMLPVLFESMSSAGSGRMRLPLRCANCFDCRGCSFLSSGAELMFDA
jgi:hypothetical protein